MARWQVVGGVDKGGIVVREGKALSSTQCGDRLSTGAVVEQMELIGDRLHYKLGTGSGPDEGWVSIKLTGKDLCIPYDGNGVVTEGGNCEWPSRLEATLSAGPVSSTVKAAAPWIGNIGKAPPQARVRLVMFNWTGNRGGAGSAHSFAKWPKLLAEQCPADTWEVCEVRLPGRGTRGKEPNVTDAKDVAQAAVDAIAKAGPPTQVVLFGFSFGAILAYETAVLLSKNGQPPLGLVVASAEHPRWAGRKTGVGKDGGFTKDTSDADFEQVLKDKGGTDMILQNPDMKKMYLPVIRSDMVMEEAYGAAPPEHDKLTCPIVAFRGKDCPIVARADVEPWLELTSCINGCPSRVEELAAGLTPGKDGGPWLCDWYLCQGEASTAKIVGAIAKDFGGGK